MSNIKIHEIAKKLNMNSKDVLEKAKELGLDIKSHLSAVSDDIAEKIENSLKSNSKVTAKKEDNKKEVVKKDKKDRTCYNKKRSNYF